MYPYDKRCNWVISGRFTACVCVSGASAPLLGIVPGGRPGPVADGSW